MSTNASLHETILEALKPVTTANWITINRFPDGNVVVILHKGGWTQTILIRCEEWMAFESPEARQSWVSRKIQEGWRQTLTAYRELTSENPLTNIMRPDGKET